MGVRDMLHSLVRGPDTATLSSLDLRSRARKQAGMPTPGGDVGYGARGWGQWSHLLPSTKIDYATEAGDLTQNSIIMACCQWIGRTFPEAPIRVMRRGKTDAEEVPDHPLTALLRSPNPYYNGLLLWQATLTDWNISGNAYWLKVRNGAGKWIETWYEPSYSCRPTWNTESTDFITGYQVKRNGQWLDVPGGRENIIHNRFGLDPRNPRLGLSPLASALREVFTDNEAANFTASLVRNTGIPGLIVSPADINGTIADPAGLKRTLIANFGGDRRGDPMVMEGPTKIDQLGFSPEQLNLEKLRNIPEERICALIGIPPGVVGLGSGLDHQTYSNLREGREAAYHNNLLPTQRLFASQLDTDALPEFGKQAREFVQFDISDVQALADDQDKLYMRLSRAYQAGWLTRSEARLASGGGYPVTPDDDVYFTDLVRLAARIGETDPPGTLLADDPDLQPGGKEPAKAHSNGHRH